MNLTDFLLARAWTRMSETETTRPVNSRSHRRLDLAGLTLLLIGIVFGGLSYWLVTDHGLSALIIIPSIVAAATGATHITKREAAK